MNLIAGKEKGLSPQGGFQEKFLSSSADIVIGGGAAGAGKSYALLLEFVRNSHNKKWNGVIFRRTFQMITSAGGLWNTANELYSNLGKANRGRYNVKTNNTKLYFDWPSGSRLSFSHLQHEKDKKNWQGSQIGFLGFDELTQFSPTQFFYLLSRNRSVSGIKPYCRCTTNPEGHGWVKSMISWFLYPDDYEVEELAGYPINDRAGKLRYFTRYRGQFVWGNSAEEVLAKLPALVARDYTTTDIKSMTFIPGLLSDNKILTTIDPSYRGNLLAMDEELMQQLLKGRWMKLKDDQDRLFPWSELSDVFTNSFIGDGRRYITADVALEGSDKFVVIVWSGYKIIDIKEYAKTTGRQVLQIIQKTAKRFFVPNSQIVVDADGVGGFLPSFLRGAHSFRNGSSAIEVENQKQNYDMLRSQCFYMLAQKIKNYELFIDISDERIIDIIIEELYVMKKYKTTKEVLSVTKKALIKEEIKRSPDYADAIMMRMFFDLIPKGTKHGSKSF